MEWGIITIVVLVTGVGVWLLARGQISKRNISSLTPSGMSHHSVSPEMMGMRFCSVCGTGWKSTYGVMKDSGMFNSLASMAGSYSPENLAGLTCKECGKSFCKEHLGQAIPHSMPGGHCPSCQGPMFVA